MNSAAVRDSMQVLVRRELEEAAKVLGERIRTNDASPEVQINPNSYDWESLWQAYIRGMSLACCQT